MLALYIIIGAALLFGIIQLFSSDKDKAEDKLKDAGEAAFGGAAISAGCLLQCVFAAIPVLIGIMLIRGCS